MNALNSQLFDNDSGTFRIKHEVEQGLENIAYAFLEYIRDDGIEIIPADIRFLGSNAGFDYTPYSDIDLHIVADFEAISPDYNLVTVALNSEKNRFNANHDITVKGIPVEVYIEDVKAGTNSEGIYSILQHRWIKYPEPEKEVNLSQYEKILSSNVSEWSSIIESAISSNNYEEIQHVINRLYMMRKNGLEKDGRYSAGNYIFKQVRNAGLLDKLKIARDDALSNKLTVESTFLTNALSRRIFQESSSEKLYYDGLEDCTTYRISQKINTDLTNSITDKLNERIQELREQLKTTYKDIQLEKLSNGVLQLKVAVPSSVQFSEKDREKLIDDIIIDVDEIKKLR